MITDQAFILHKRLFKDSSELIKLMTLNYGIVDVIAKGSLRAKSKLKGQLQPFIPTQVNIIGQSSLKTLIDAEQSAVLKSCAFINHVSMLYCNELLVMLKLDDEAVRNIFATYQQTLEQLSTVQSVSLPLRQFEWQLCSATGYELTLPADISASDCILFDPESGLVIDSDKGYCGAQVLADFLTQEPLNDHQLRQVGRLMKVVVKHMVGGKTIQSRQLLNKTFDSYRKL